MEASKQKKLLCRIFFAVATVCLLIPFLLTIITSLKDFRISVPFFEQKDAGFEHYARFFSKPFSKAIISNSMLCAFFSLLFGSAYVYVASISISNTKNNILKALIFILFCIPALIPADTYSHALTKLGQLTISQAGYNLMAEPSILFMVYSGIVDAFRLSGFVLITSLFIKQDTMKESLKVMLLFIAVKLITFFTGDLQTLLSLQNPANYESTSSFSSYIYETGLLMGDYSHASAVTVIRSLMQLVPAALACVIMIFTFKSKPAPQQPKQGFVAFSAFGMLSVAVLFFVMLFAGSLLFDKIFEYDPFIPSVAYSIIYTFCSALLVTAAAMGLSLLARNAGTIGIICLTVLLLTADNLMGNYMFLIRATGTMNTPFGVILYNMKLVPLTTLVFTFASRNECNIKKDIAICVIGFFVLFAYFWGDFMSVTITISDSSKFNFPVLLRSLSFSLSASSGIGNMPQFEMLPGSTVPYILLPIALATGGAILSAILSKTKAPSVEARTNQEYPKY